MYGLIFHILDLTDPDKNRIFKWNFMQPYRGSVQPETLLGLNIKVNQTDLSPQQILNNFFIARNVPFIKSSSTIFFEKVPNLSLLLTDTSVAGFVKKHKMAYKIGLGNSMTARAFGGVRSVPTTLIVGRDGTIHKVLIGASPVKERQIRQQIKRLLDS